MLKDSIDDDGDCSGLVNTGTYPELQEPNCDTQQFAEQATENIHSKSLEICDYEIGDIRKANIFRVRLVVDGFSNFV